MSPGGLLLIRHHQVAAYADPVQKHDLGDRMTQKIRRERM
jgi:hypothetical protein